MHLLLSYACVMVYHFRGLPFRNLPKLSIMSSYTATSNSSTILTQVRYDVKRGFFVQGLFEVEIRGLNDIMAVVDEGNGNRRVSSHLLNKDSSRSHSLLTVYLHSEWKDPDDGHVVKMFGKVRVLVTAVLWSHALILLGYVAVLHLLSALLIPLPLLVPPRSVRHDTNRGTSPHALLEIGTEYIVRFPRKIAHYYVVRTSPPPKRIRTH